MHPLATIGRYVGQILTFHAVILKKEKEKKKYFDEVPFIDLNLMMTFQAVTAPL